jgi:hypothetical protein
MKATELRIGNYVDVINKKEEVHLPSGKIFKVGFISRFKCELYHCDSLGFTKGSRAFERISKIHPIDLTKDWLEVFDFNEDGLKWIYAGLIFFKGGAESYFFNAGRSLREVKYVHQLQNLVFDLIGHELSIKQ